MSFVLFTVIGFLLGYRLGMTRKGYLTMMFVAAGFSLVQIIHLLLTQDPESMTLLPIVIGLILVLSMLLGALFHSMLHRNRKVI